MVAIAAKQRLDSLRNDEIKIKNRVNLLESEQKRILKKVEETRTRASKITTIKKANEQNYLEKLMRKNENEVEIRTKQMHHAQEKLEAQRRKHDI